MSHNSSHLATFLARRAHKSPDDVALRFKRGSEWESLSFRGWHQSSLALANSLQSMGVRKGDRILVVCSTRPEWAVLAWAAAWCRAVIVTLNSSALQTEIAAAVEATAPTIVMVEDPAVLSRAMDAISHLKGRIVFFDAECVTATSGAGTPFIRIDDLGLDRNWLRPFHALTQSAPSLELERSFTENIDDAAQHDTAAIFFTPGTLQAKGVMLSHSALVYQAGTLSYVLPLSPDDTQLLFLPFSHALGVVSLLSAVAAGVPVALGGGPRSLLEDMQAIRPTTLVAVPRVYQKMAERLSVMIEELPLVWREVVKAGIKAGKAIQESAQAGEKPDLLTKLPFDIAKGTLFPQFKELFGGRMRFMVSSAAPLPAEVGKTIGALGIPVLEAYGLTEAGGATHINRLGSQRMGTVGQPLPLVETRIMPDGEILVRSPGVMQGYLNDTQATKETMQDGWLLTGDLGSMSPDGYLTITGRKKAIIVTAAGKGVSPQRVESMLLEGLPLAAHALVEGEGRSHLVALLVLDPASLAAWANERELTSNSLKELARSHDLYKEMERGLAAVNERLAPHERVRAFAILDRELDVESGELTQDFKVRRHIVLQRHKQMIETLFKERY